MDAEMNKWIILEKSYTLKKTITTADNVYEKCMWATGLRVWFNCERKVKKFSKEKVI